MHPRMQGTQHRRVRAPALEARQGGPAREKLTQAAAADSPVSRPGPTVIYRTPGSSHSPSPKAVAASPGREAPKAPTDGVGHANKHEATKETQRSNARAITSATCNGNSSHRATGLEARPRQRPRRLCRHGPDLDQTQAYPATHQSAPGQNKRNTHVKQPRHD